MLLLPNCSTDDYKIELVDVDVDYITSYKRKRIVPVKKNKKKKLH